MIVYFDCRTGMYDTITDMAYITDNYGNLVTVPFSFPHWFLADI